ncbi:MAG: tetratricopeptide repeat protein, partial [Kiritimatiellales bacterium]|nr:tetratricopeptide repeat protein [Kiritimatiellales bacterium]
VLPLSEVFKLAKKDAVRSGAAVMLVTCYVREGDFENLFKFLPYCDESARHDVGLNVALIEAGDKNYSDEEYGRALLLYRLVLLKTDLITHYETQIKKIKASAKRFAAGSGQSLDDYKADMRKKKLRMTRMEEQLKVIQEFQDYDLDVAVRIAQCYADLRRIWPAYTIYKHIYTDFPEHKLAEQSRFSAFAVLLGEHEFEMALVEGYAYVDLYPGGQYAEDVTLNLMQVHMQNTEVDKAMAIGQRALELFPAHRYVDQIKYLMGYIRFSKQDYADALGLFTDVVEQFPNSIYGEAADYWQAMCYLFLGRFEEGLAAFQEYLGDPRYEPKQFGEDATYRMGICQYGVGQYPESEATFRTFAETYPSSDLVSEAYSMIGDLRAAEADLDVALEFYGKGRETAISIDQVNYSVFQSAKVLELEKRFEEIIVLMQEYLDEWGEEGNFAGAGYWLGKCYKAQGDYPKTLDIYLQTIADYGNKPEHDSIDLILKELINDYKSDEWKQYRGDMIEKLTIQLDGTRSNREKTLRLRLQTLFAYVTEGAERHKYVMSIVKKDNITSSGPLTLVLMAQEGNTLAQYDLVHEAYKHFMSKYEESDLLVDVMNAELDAIMGEERYEDALAMVEEITSRFGYSVEVGWTRKRKGDAHRFMEQYDDAIKTYNELFAVREWRGPLTPEALYWIGVCKQKQGKSEEAFAFFQRVYVLYQEYTQWVAPSYDGSIDCLTKLGRTQDVIKTYEEMVANEAIAKTPQGKKALQALRKLQPAGGTK